MLGTVRQKLWLLAHRNQRQRFDYQRKRRDDRCHNGILDRNQSKILIVRDSSWGAEYNDHFIEWVDKNYPDFGSRIRLGRLPAYDEDLSDVALLVPWLQDPLKELYPTLFRHALHLQNRCDRLGIRVVNRVDRLSTSIKSVALPLLAKNGVRAAAVKVIDSIPDFCEAPGLPFPFFIRDDYVHGCPTTLIRNTGDLDAVDWSQWAHPIAVEFIDTSDDQGHYRKYRYYLFGDVGQSRHLMVSKDWNVRAKGRVKGDQFDQAEWDFFSSPNPHHDLFNQLRKALGYDFVAFDYGLDRDGQVVLFEPNPFPIMYNGASAHGSRLHYIEPVYEKLVGFLKLYASDPSTRS